MLEVIVGADSAARYDSTVILPRESLPLGGATCNLYWYLTQLGRKPIVATHYAASDAPRMRALMTGDAGRFHAEKSSATDVLIVLPTLSTASLYIAGALNTDDISKMLAGIADDGVVVFVGSRHGALRSAYLKKVATLTKATVVFAPSYTMYDFTPEELRDFLASSHLTFINEHEAAHACKLLGAINSAELFKSSKLGGIVTLGPGGASLYPRGGGPVVCPSVSGSQADVIGAGEAFMCGFLHSYLNTGSWETAGTFGCALAAQVVRGGKVRMPIHPEIAPASR